MAERGVAGDGTVPVLMEISIYDNRDLAGHSVFVWSASRHKWRRLHFFFSLQYLQCISWLQVSSGPRPFLANFDGGSENGPDRYDSTQVVGGDRGQSHRCDTSA